MTNPLLHKGLLINDYVLESFIGAGTQADVWLVRELRGGKRSLACKIFACKFDERGTRENLIKKSALEREADILGDLNHSYIAKYYYVIDGDFENENGVKIYIYGLLFNFSPIGTLSKLISRQDHLDIDTRLDIVRRLGDAVEHIHDVKIVHSDLKPDNIILYMEGKSIVPVIMDFGGAFRINENHPGFLTPEYAAPEIRPRGARPTFSSDVFALGLIFHEILTSKKLPLISDVTAYSDPIDERLFPESIRRYSGVIRRMVRNDLERRPTASEIRSSIERQQQERTIRTASSTSRQLKFPIREYIWNPHVHEILGSAKRFVFLKGSRPTTEARWLDSNLNREDIYGCSVRRLFGSFDFLLEIWLSREAAEKLEFICSKFQSEHSYIKTRPIHLNARILFSNSKLKRLSSPNKATILDTIHSAIEGDKTASRTVLSKAGLIEDFSFPKRGVRFFLDITSSDDMPDHAIEYYARVIFEYLNEKIPASFRKWINVYRLDQQNRIFVVLLTREFIEYKDILLGVSRVLRKKTVNEVLQFTTSTHIDLDGTGFIESDDGYIPNLLQYEFG